MDLPVEPWKLHLLQKWSLLPTSVQGAISAAETLSDIFLLSYSHLQPEDELFLKSLSGDYLVGKDPKAPLFYREEGNRKFEEKDFAGAAVLYSKGVSHAGPNTEDMSLCYGNRSAALFHLGQFEACLEDISRAELHRYPERLLPKMLLRKAECLLALGRPQEASLTVAALEGHLAAQPNLAPSRLRALQSSLDGLKLKVRNQETFPETSPAAPSHTVEDTEILEKSKQVPSASSSVRLDTDPVKGRCLVATRDILPGELLVKEDAFVSVLIPGEEPPLRCGLGSRWDAGISNGDLYCHQCLKPTLATVPCPRCSYAKYCSPRCLQQAWEQHHSTECPLGALLHTLGIFCHTALRLTLVARFQDAGQISKKLSHEISVSESKPPIKSFSCGPGEREKEGTAIENPIPGCDVHGKYENNYNAIFSLLPHTHSHSPEHKFLCALSVAALCRQLQAAGSQALFPGDLMSLQTTAAAPQEPCPDWHIWGVAMLRHMLQLQCNAQAITAIQQTDSKESLITSSRQVRLATGVFPVLSLLNHSCSPNTSVSFVGTVATVRASQHISQGQEILHCYGPHVSHLDVAVRQQKLKSQYFFDCSCPACCSEAQPTTAGPRWAGFCCSSCRALLQGDAVLHCGSGSCPEAVSRDRLASRLRDLKRQIAAALELLGSGKLRGAIQQLQGCQRTAESFLWVEHSLLGEIADYLAQAYATLGDWQKAAAHLRKSLAVVEAHYGTSSIEMGHELFKLAQILFNGMEIHEALSTIQKAEGVLLVHCGPCSDEVLELRQMRSCLLNLLPGPMGPSV
ncbi:SET and MYND domain-containing protein 4 [Ochotona princeps]|uniref:SET and MYND domain-containing protein 4 n=1 Tax=Ochotona princeps TaxID=9978 RepID=UPI0027145CAB|nr:SET and MYND domain-containing protein 4 [Ochotona princeps]